MESYFQAKLLLFTGLEPHKTIVVNSDEQVAQDIIRKTKSKAYTFGLSTSSDIHPQAEIGRAMSGLTFSAQTPQGLIDVKSGLVGKHNAYNILGAIGIGISLGFSAESIARGISAMKAVPGRMEKVDVGQPFGVIVDYAHTEDSLANLLDAVRDMAEGRVITLFGCGGERDRSKRPKMGAAALQGSDIVIITTDNPRTEKPLDIICEIENGMQSRGEKVTQQDLDATVSSGKKPYAIIADRHEAIAQAVQLARPNDVVVLAGKGHETYQIIGEQKMHFDDREVAREEIRKRIKAGVKGQGSGVKS
jgi:UDP-N-acetylmuramoyl-L-alanyl-D-glutamate--2,6-diaminopimelate ligase